MRLVVAAASLAGFACATGAAEPIKIGFGLLRNRRQRGGRQAVSPDGTDLGRASQRQGRALGPQGRTRPLRRSEQSWARAWHLHEAARRRQGRSHHRLGHQLQLGGDADHNPAWRDVARYAGVAVNEEFHYPRFFQTMPYGPHGKDAISAGYFAAAMTMDPKPKTIALTGADAEFSKNGIEGAKHHAAEAGLKIVYVASIRRTRWISPRSFNRSRRPSLISYSWLHIPPTAPDSCAWSRSRVCPR